MPSDRVRIKRRFRNLEGHFTKIDQMFEELCGIYAGEDDDLVALLSTAAVGLGEIRKIMAMVDRKL